MIDPHDANKKRKRPKTLELILHVDKPYSSAKSITPLLPDGTSDFSHIVNRNALMAEIKPGDTVECLITRKREIVTGVGVLEWYDD